jgi:hypothetical protein
MGVVVIIVLWSLLGSSSYGELQTVSGGVTETGRPNSYPAGTDVIAPEEEIRSLFP